MDTVQWQAQVIDQGKGGKGGTKREGSSWDHPGISVDECCGSTAQDPGTPLPREPTGDFRLRPVGSQHHNATDFVRIPGHFRRYGHVYT
jgi:hypothetical protein